MSNFIWCFTKNAENLVCNGTEFIKFEPPLNIYDEFFWIYLAVYICLTLGAGLMSGLTLGLLSLDALDLEILIKAGMEPEARYAKKLYPIIKKKHILLVTLLLGNAACVESMPIFLDRISNPVTAIAVSVTAVLIFGEVIPQALCKRYGLAIGYYMRPMVYLLMGVSMIIAYPISKMLDCIFGNENGDYYRRPQLKALIDLHGPSGFEIKNSEIKYNSDATHLQIEPNLTKNEKNESKNHEFQLSIEEVNIIKGALDLTTMTAKDALVPLEHVFMLSDAAILDKYTIRQILLVAHSRIPVYSGTERRLIQGILLTKMLIQFNNSETLKIKTLIRNNKCFRPLRYVTETTPLYDLLKLFKTGKTGHMAVVVKDDIAEEQLDALERFSKNDFDKKHSNLVSVFPPVIGIITLEDVLEKLIQSEIIDEGDIYRHDICRQLLYKQKLRWAKLHVFQASPSNPLIDQRLIETDIMKNYVSKDYEPMGRAVGERTPLSPENQPDLYNTFMNS